MLQAIVPLNFSEISLNAAHYACAMYKGRTNVTILLYDFYTDEEEITTGQNYLTSLKTELLAIAPNIETNVESGDNFIDSLSAYAPEVRPVKIFPKNGKFAAEKADFITFAITSDSLMMYTIDKMGKIIYNTTIKNNT